MRTTITEDGIVNSLVPRTSHVSRQSSFGAEKHSAAKMQVLAAGSRALSWKGQGHMGRAASTSAAWGFEPQSLCLSSSYFSHQISLNHAFHSLFFPGLLFAGTILAHSFQSGGLLNTQASKKTVATISISLVPFPLFTQSVFQRSMHAHFSMCQSEAKLGR